MNGFHSKRRPRLRLRRRLARRRPGEGWDFWRMEARERGSGVVKVTGYLVTDRGRVPRPIALIPHGGISGLMFAVAIRGGARPDRSRRNRGSIRWYDGDGADWDVPRELHGMLLLPIDSRGRWITRDRSRWAAMYLHWPAFGDKVGFFTITDDGLRAGTSVSPPYPRAPQERPFAGPRCGGRRRRPPVNPKANCSAGKSGTPAVPSAPSGGARKSRKGGRQASA